MLRLLGALLRAGLVLAVVALPALLLPGSSRNSLEISLIAGGLGALFTLVEYGATNPGLVDFRYAPPYNRGRFLLFSVILVALVFLARAGAGADAFGPGYLALADRATFLTEIPLLPVRLLFAQISAGEAAGQVALVRRATALAYVIAIAGMAFLILVLWIFRWPQGRERFNLWINLPTFVPSSGRDVERRLMRNGAIYLVAGLALPYLLTALASPVLGWVEPASFRDPQLLVWSLAIWAGLPASLAIRGAALLKIGWLVKRARKV